MSHKLKVQYWPIDDVKPYPNNPRNNDDAVEYVANSIREFSFQQPIVVDTDGTIIAGHTRLKAAKLLGMEQVPVVVADNLTPAQVNAYRLADNKVAEAATWDMEALAVELEGLEVDFDMTMFDFDASEFDFGGLGGEPTEIVEDEVPEDAPSIVQKGDVWQLGRHRLMCGDSTDADSVARLMDGTKADMVFTDPPYGYSYESNMRTKSEKFGVIYNDDKILDFFPNLHEIANGFVMVCTTWKVLDKWLPLFSKYFAMTNMIIWDKGGGFIGDLKHTFGTDYEIILCSNNGCELTGKRIGSVWSIGKNNANDYKHPTQKPVELPATAIEHTTDTGQLVLDLFGGSGSTLIACEQLERTCYMMELDPHYCDIIIERWQNLTGETARKVEQDG